MKADRRLWLSSDKDTVVEDGDIAAATLLAAPGHGIAASDVKRLRLVTDSDGRVMQASIEAPEPAKVAEPEVKELPKPEDKALAKPATKTVTKKKATKKKVTKRRSKG